MASDGVGSDGSVGWLRGMFPGGEKLKAWNHDAVVYGQDFRILEFHPTPSGDMTTALRGYPFPGSRKLGRNRLALGFWGV